MEHSVLLLQRRNSPLQLSLKTILSLPRCQKHCLDLPYLLEFQSCSFLCETPITLTWFINWIVQCLIHISVNTIFFFKHIAIIYYIHIKCHGVVNTLVNEYLLKAFVFKAQRQSKFLDILNDYKLWHNFHWSTEWNLKISSENYYVTYIFYIFTPFLLLVRITFFISL